MDVSLEKGWNRLVFNIEVDDTDSVTLVTLLNAASNEGEIYLAAVNTF